MQHFMRILRIIISTCHCRGFYRLGLIMVFILASASGRHVLATQINYKISGSMPAYGNVKSNPSFILSPDGMYVLYLADPETDEAYYLYRGSVDGSSQPLRLSQLVPPDRSIINFDISPDSKHVIYRGDQDTVGVTELYSVSINSGVIIKLNDTLVASGDAGYFYISPDSSRVVYRADQDTDTMDELYSVAITGGPVTKLNGTLPPGGDVNYISLSISPDSKRVVYLADQDTDNIQELYSVPITGGDSVKLNGVLIDQGDVGSFLISPDGQYVVYWADQEVDGTHELYTVPIAGGPAIKINGPLVTGGEIFNFQISPDGQRVVYIADQLIDNTIEIFSVPITGGQVIKLNNPLAAGTGVIDANFFISHDSNIVVFLVGSGGVSRTQEIYSVPISGGTPVKINDPVVEFGDIVDFSLSISPDNKYVAYTASQDDPGVKELYAVALDGSSSTKLNDPMVPGGEVYSGQPVTISPDGKLIVYIADQDINNVNELYAVPLTGGPVTKLSHENAWVNYRFKISPNGKRVVYSAEDRTTFQFELFGVNLPSTGSSLLLMLPALLSGQVQN